MKDKNTFIYPSSPILYPCYNAAPRLFRLTYFHQKKVCILGDARQARTKAGI